MELDGCHEHKLFCFSFAYFVANAIYLYLEDGRPGSVILPHCIGTSEAPVLPGQGVLEDDKEAAVELTGGVGWRQYTPMR